MLAAYVYLYYVSGMSGFNTLACFFTVLLDVCVPVALSALWGGGIGWYSVEYILDILV